MASFIQIFAVIGFLALFVGIIYLIRKGMSSTNQVAYSDAYPPNDYMLNIGAKCPDMWTNIGYTKVGNVQYVRCRNDANVPLASETCYTNVSNKIRQFANIAEWPIKPSDQTTTLKSRCDWIKTCGPAPGTRASWTGISDKCS
jgi:hypothetical protein